MQWTVIIALAVVIVIGAYVLGTYLRRQQEGFPPVRRAPAPKQPAKKLASPAPPGDREVQAVVTWLLSQAFEQTGVKVADDALAYERIVEAARKAVNQLKSQDTVDISLPFLTADASGPKHLEARLTRGMIQELVKY